MARRLDAPRLQARVPSLGRTEGRVQPHLPDARPRRHRPALQDARVRARPAHFCEGRDAVRGGEAWLGTLVSRRTAAPPPSAGTLSLTTLTGPRSKAVVEPAGGRRGGGTMEGPARSARC